MYPITYEADFNPEPNRVTTFFRIFVAIPIFIVLGAVDGGGNYTSHAGHYSWSFAAGAGGILVFGPLLMILFRQKYPRWWFDWNLELTRFTTRVTIYAALSDRSVRSFSGALAISPAANTPS